MSVFAPLLFKSSDPGAPTLSGTAGNLLNVLNACLIINKAFAAVSAGSFLDRTAEAQTQGGTAFTMFQTPGTNDEFYIGMSVKFGRAKFTLATLGVGGTYVWEYWNGSAWTTLTVTDGTTGFTASGIVTWTAPANWVSTAVNGVTLLWVRARLTVANSTNPTVTTLTVTGWSIAFGPTTNQADYQQGGGNQFYLDVNDNAPGAGTGKEARAFGFEAMSALGVGTGQYPTTVQRPAGIIPRKSATADATTRTWLLIADDRTLHLFVLTTDGAGTYYTFSWGDFYSEVLNDSFRTQIIGRHTENDSGSGGENFGTVETACNQAVRTGHYVVRAYTGLGSSVQNLKITDSSKSNGANGLFGVVPFLNGPNGGLYLVPITLCESSHLRGRLRGVWAPMHAVASYNDGDTFNGNNQLAGRTFLVVKNVLLITGTAGAAVLETSDTWDTN